MSTISMNLILALLLFITGCQVKKGEESSIVETENNYTTTITGTSSIIADGVATSTITINVKELGSNVAGIVPTFEASGSGNTYGTCSATNASGNSTCTLASTKSGSKFLYVETPAYAIGGAIEFLPGAATASTSQIISSGPTYADGVTAATITVMLRDINSNPVSGITPTFSATDTGSTNIYGACSVSNSSGNSTCSLKSTMAEIKVLSLLTPFAVTGASVFIGGTPVAGNSTITGTGSVVANGTATSTITITLRDAYMNTVLGKTPTFTATDPDSTNVYGACSQSSSSGISTCTLKSLRTGTKTLAIATPVVQTGGTVVFTAGSAVAANSTITGTSPVTANGATTSTVTITLKDVNTNAVSGVTPTFSATNTGTTNSYSACTSSDTSGISTCTMTSTKAEIKTLSIATPVAKAGGTVTFVGGAAATLYSTITSTGSTIANGSATKNITVTLKDVYNNPVQNQTPTFTATDTGSTNNYGACSASDASGISICTMTSTKAETKTLSIATPITKADGTAVFIAGSAHASHSSISGTGPIEADGVSTSSISITTADIYNNPLVGITPVFSATNTGNHNTYGTCSATNSSGNSTCTLKSTTAEAKTLQLTSPLSLTGNVITFTATAADATNSTITGTGPVLADGTTPSTVTITLKNVSNVAVVGTTPTFSASGSNNSYGACTATNASGVSTCSLTSTTAEVKTLSIATPVSKADGTVTFNAGTPSAAQSTISGESTTISDGADTCTVTVTIKDANGNGIAGETPTYAVTGSSNTLGACSVTDASGVSTCDFTSTQPESKTVSLLTPVAVAGNTITFNPIGINLEVPIEMVDRGLASSTSTLIFERTRTSLNTSDYVAGTNEYVFEIIADNANTMNQYAVTLVDSTGSQIASSSLNVPANSSYQRLRTTFTPNSGSDNYRVRIASSAANNQVKIYAARMIVRQTNATETKIYIPLTGNDASDANSDDSTSSALSNTNGTTYSQPVSDKFYFWTRNDAQFDAIASGTPWTLETVTSIADAGATASAALFDKVNDQQITEAVTTNAGATSPTLRTTSFAGNASNFDDGDTLEVRIKSSGTHDAYLYRAGLWLKLKFLRKAEIYARLATRSATGTTKELLDGRFLWDSSAWSNPTAFFEIFAEDVTTTVDLLDDGTNDSGSSSPSVVDSITPGASYASTRTGSLSLTDTHRYFVRHNRPSSTGTVSGSFLVIRATE